MSRIVNDHDEAITNQNDILNELATLYTNLYNQKTERESGTRTAVDTFLEGIEFPKLEEEADRCEGLVTTEEVGQALNAMKNGSAPDGNGLIVELLTFFWPKLKIMVTNTFNEAFASEELTHTPTKNPPNQRDKRQANKQNKTLSTDYTAKQHKRYLTSGLRLYFQTHLAV